MRWPYFIAQLLIICYAETKSFSQSRYLHAETFGTRNGLLSSKIYSLFQSSDRRLWAGTELGVSVYDGYQFTNYQYTNANTTIGRVLSITQDPTGTMWIGGDKGLFYFSGTTPVQVSINGKYFSSIEALITDASGCLWIGNMNGLFKINSTGLKEINLNKKSPEDLVEPTSLKARVLALGSDEKNNIYVGSTDGLYAFTNKTGTGKKIWNNITPNNPVISVAAFSEDSIYWNCLNSHPYQMINGKIFTRYTDDYIGRTVFIHLGKIYALTTNGVGQITDGYAKPVVQTVSYTNHAVNALIDAEENIWIGSWEGLLKFRQAGFRRYPMPANHPKETFSFIERPNSDLLFGSNRGTLYTIKNNEVVIAPDFPPLFPLAEVMCLYNDNNGGLWAGSGYEGISLYKNKKLSNWNNTGFLKDNNCEALVNDGQGRMYACTENGVTLIDHSRNEPMIAHYPFEQLYTRKPELFGCFQIQNTGTWFYGSQGLFKLENDVLKSEAIAGINITDLYINKIISDQKGNIWIATLGKGLLQCSLKNKKMVLKKIYDHSNGLPSDVVLSVIEDKNNNIWTGDYMGLAQIVSPDNVGRIIRYNERDGLLSSYYQNMKLEKSSTGHIWGLTSTGLFSFHPDSVYNNQTAPLLLLNHVSVKEKKENLAGLKKPVLGYRNNTVSFDFTAISLTDPSKILYAYRIPELDSNWTYSYSRSIQFNALSPGKYTFQLKAANNSNRWSDEVLQYPFTIRPAVWQTRWFSIAVILFIAGLAVLFVRKRITLIRTKAAVQQQLQELESKALRSQMNPHFIFNSLNAIQELIVLKNVDEAYQYLSEFSRLLRMVLHNSQMKTIPLSAETEMIQLQLSLESLRFRNSFSYHIETETITEPDMINIPPMLLQPFVENALWHGLRHKQGIKKLHIRISENNGQLNIEIQDNGVGRKRSAEIRNQKIGVQVFSSKGIALARQRLSLLNNDNQHRASIDIVDRYDSQNQPSGTLVKICLPSNLK